MHKLTPEQITDVCDRYQRGESSLQLGQIFGISTRAVCGLLKRRGIERRSQSEAHRIYTCNHRFFQTISTGLQAYWLGFLAADVSMTTRKAVALKLAPKDHDHLVRFATALQSTHPVLPYRNGAYMSVRIYIASPEMSLDLAQYGVIPNKTYTVRWPTLPLSLEHHFLRGYWDGDGGLSFSASDRLTPNVTFHLTGNQPFILACQERLMNACQLSRTRLDQRHTTPIFTLRYVGRHQVRRIAEWLYTDATVYLPRKRLLAY